MIEIIFLEIILIISLYTDIKYNKILNIITFPSMFIGIFLNVNGNIKSSLLGLSVIIVAYIPVYIMGAVAAGDVKLMMAIGIILGYKLTIFSVLFVVIANLIISIVILHRNSKLKEVIKQTFEEIKYRFFSILSKQSKESLGRPSINPQIRFPYSPGIFIGVNMAIIMIKIFQ